MNKWQNPYVGLRPFEVDESLLFFGRNEQTSELLQRLHKNHFVAVVGSSGSGKSSLLKSGLIPALKGGFLVEGSDRWVIAMMKPGQNPLANFAACILEQIQPGFGQSDLAKLLEDIKDHGAEAIIQILSRYSSKKDINFFLLVDQFEEIFRFAKETENNLAKDDAIDFVNIMLELSNQTTLPVYVVITMRSDFIGECANYNGLPEAMNKSQYLVPRLNRMQMKKSIEGPAKLFGGSFSHTLTSRLLNEINSISDELPLLQHVLMRIWEYGSKHDTHPVFDLAVYEETGGLEKALSYHAEEALDGMSKEDLFLTKKLFQALTMVDEGGRKIRRPKRLSALIKLTNSSKEDLLKIIRQLNDDRRSFLVLTELPTKDDYLIDISHESLMRVWERLRLWVEEEAESVKIYHRICESALLHLNGKAGLWRDPELQIVLDWRKNNSPNTLWASQYNANYELAMAFIDESLSEKNALHDAKKRRFRNTYLAIGFFMVVISTLAIWAFVQKNTARNEAQKAREAETLMQVAKNLAEQNESKAKLASDSANASRKRAVKASGEALMNANEAKMQAGIAMIKTKEAEIQAEIAKRKTEEAESQAEKARKLTDETISQKKVLQDQNDQIKKSKEKLENQNILTKVQYLTILLQNNSIEDKELKGLLALQAQIFNKRLNKNFEPGIFTVLFSANKAFQRPAEYRHNYNSETVNDLKFSPDGKSIASIDANGNLIVCDATNFALPPKKFKKQIDLFETLAFNENGNLIAVTTNLKTVFIYNVNDHGQNPKKVNITFADKVSSVVWWKNMIILAANNNSLEILDAGNGNRVKTIPLESKPICMDINKSKGILVVGSANGQIYTVELSQYKVEKRLSSPSGKPITCINLNATGNDIAFGNFDGKVFTMPNSMTNKPVEIGNHKSKITDIRYYPGSHSLATSSLDGTIKIWNLNSPGDIPVCFCSEHTGSVLGLDLNPQGDHIISGGRDMTVRNYLTDQDKLIKSLQSKITRNLTKDEWIQYFGESILYEETIKLN